MYWCADICTDFTTRACACFIISGEKEEAINVEEEDDKLVGIGMGRRLGLDDLKAP